MNFEVFRVLKDVRAELQCFNGVYILNFLNTILKLKLNLQPVVNLKSQSEMTTSNAANSGTGLGTV